MLCTAKSRSTGKPCKGQAIRGATVCRLHGGSAPQVKAKALERLKALQPLAITQLEALLTCEENAVRHGAVKTVFDYSGLKPTDKLKLSGEVKHTIDLEHATDEQLEAITGLLGALAIVCPDGAGEAGEDEDSDLLPE